MFCRETFIALLNLREQPSRPEHYCVRTFRNRALNYRRSLWRRLAREWESLRWFERTPDETATEVQAMNSLAQLPRDQREAIVLKIWHNYTFEEIGALLEVSPNTVAGRYRYGLQKTGEPPSKEIRMSEMNELELRLRSWAPRRPSGGL